MSNYKKKEEFHWVFVRLKNNTRDVLQSMKTGNDTLNDVIVRLLRESGAMK